MEAGVGVSRLSSGLFTFVVGPNLSHRHVLDQERRKKGGLGTSNSEPSWYVTSLPRRGTVDVRPIRSLTTLPSL